MRWWILVACLVCLMVPASAMLPVASVDGSVSRVFVVPRESYSPGSDVYLRFSWVNDGVTDLSSPVVVFSGSWGDFHLRSGSDWHMVQPVSGSCRSFAFDGVFPSGYSSSFVVSFEAPPTSSRLGAELMCYIGGQSIPAGSVSFDVDVSESGSVDWPMALVVFGGFVVSVVCCIGSFFFGLRGLIS